MYGEINTEWWNAIPRSVFQTNDKSDDPSDDIAEAFIAKQWKHFNY